MLKVEAIDLYYGAAQALRGVSVGVTAVSSAGGFVVPNDHVDVLLTTSTSAGQQSEVVLSNVRVLAIGKRLGEMGASGGDEKGENAGPTPVTFENNTIATLELTPSQAETLINASMRGQLSLTLRSVVDFGRSADVKRPPNTSQAVRVIRFGKEQSVLAGTTAEAVPVQPEFIPSSDAVSSGVSDATSAEIQVEAVEPQLMPQ